MKPLSCAWPLPSQGLILHRYNSCSCLIDFNGLRWEVVICFVGIGWIFFKLVLTFFNCWSSLFNVSYHNNFDLLCKSEKKSSHRESYDSLIYIYLYIQSVLLMLQVWFTPMAMCILCNYEIKFVRSVFIIFLFVHKFDSKYCRIINYIK
jgi:hypothetical protein